MTEGKRMKVTRLYTGEDRRFSTGDVLLVEDTTGRGHITRTVDGRARKSLFVTLE